MKRKLIIILAVISLFIVVGYFINLESGDYHPNWKYEDILETKKIGDDISVALIKYYNANKRFPEALDRLTPKYLDQIQSPKVGKLRWEYDRHEYDKHIGGVSIFAEGVDGEVEPIMILTIKSADLSTEWYFDSK